MIHRRALIAALGGATVAAGCGTADAPPTVFAAASLQDVLQEIGADYRRATGRDIRFSFAASSAMARQIEQGAPAALFISADSDWMDHLARGRRIVAASRVNLLGNRLALIAPATSSVQRPIGPAMDLAAALGPDDRLAMAASEVPAGRYGEAALQSLGLWEDVAARTVRGESVRTALAFVARGEAPLGIVYETDALAEKRVKVVGLFPADSYPQIVYPAAVVAGPDQAAGQAFLTFMQGAEAKAVFSRYGFSRPATAARLPSSE